MAIAVPSGNLKRISMDMMIARMRPQLRYCRSPIPAAATPAAVASVAKPAITASDPARCTTPNGNSAGHTIGRCPMSWPAKIITMPTMPTRTAQLIKSHPRILMCMFMSCFGFCWTWADASSQPHLLQDFACCSTSLPHCRQYMRLSFLLEANVSIAGIDMDLRAVLPQPASQGPFTIRRHVVVESVELRINRTVAGLRVDTEKSRGRKLQRDIAILRGDGNIFLWRFRESNHHVAISVPHCDRTLRIAYVHILVGRFHRHAALNALHLNGIVAARDRHVTLNIFDGDRAVRICYRRRTLDAGHCDRAVAVVDFHVPANVSCARAGIAVANGHGFCHLFDSHSAVPILHFEDTCYAANIDGAKPVHDILPSQQVLNSHSSLAIVDLKQRLLGNLNGHRAFEVPPLSSRLIPVGSNTVFRTLIRN